MFIISQSHFRLPKITIQKIGVLKFTYQTDYQCDESLNKIILACDMSYDEVKQICREAWETLMSINKIMEKNGVIN